MTWQLLTRLADEYALHVVFYGGILFALLYTFIAPWWKTVFGRTLVVLDTSLSAITLQYILRTDFGYSNFNAQAAAWIGAVGIVVAASVIVSRIWMLISLNKDIIRHKLKRLAAHFQRKRPTGPRKPWRLLGRS